MRRVMIGILGLVVWLAGTNAQNKIEMSVWPDTCGIQITSYIPTMTIYFPKNPNGIAVMMCSGGGYDHLAITHEGHDMASWFNSQGITYIVLKYRLPINHQHLPLLDARQAMQTIRSHAKEWRIEKNKIGIMGASAGGHLASSLATMYENAIERPDFQILLYPVISMQADITNVGTRNRLIGPHPSEEAVNYYSTDKRVNGRTPPAFIVLSADDKGVLPDNSLCYFNALRKYGISVELHVYPTGGHGWGFKDSFLYKQAWTTELVEWFKKGISL